MSEERWRDARRDGRGRGGWLKGGEDVAYGIPTRIEA